MNHDSALKLLRQFLDELYAADTPTAERSELWRAIQQTRCLSEARHLTAAIGYAIKVLERQTTESSARITELEWQLRRECTKNVQLEGRLSGLRDRIIEAEIPEGSKYAWLRRWAEGE